MDTSKKTRGRPLAVAVVALGLLPASASAQVPGIPALPALGQIVSDTGQTASGPLPPQVGGVVTTVTGTAGGVITGTTQQVTGQVDSTLGGLLSGANGLLPAGVLGELLVPVAANNPAVGGSSGGVIQGGVNTPGGVVVDGRAPLARVRVLRRLKRVGQTGRLPLEVSLDEPGVVALAGTLRPGAKRRVRGKPVRGTHNRRVSKVPAVVLAFRRAGRLNVNVALSRTLQRKLARSRDMRLSLATLAADVSRNQAIARHRRTVRR